MEHTGSYYAASVNRQTDFAPLRGIKFPVNSFIVATKLLSAEVFANIRPPVIPGSFTLQKPLVTLGMLYYRIKDRI